MKKPRIAIDLDETWGVTVTDSTSIIGFRLRDGCTELLQRLKSKYHFQFLVEGNHTLGLILNNKLIMKELPIIQSLWIGNKLSTMEQLSITSFLRNGHSFHLYVYDEVAGIPPKTIIKDANQIIPIHKIFKYKGYDSYAGFSNIFRYQLLLERGNFWVDTDVIALKPFNFSSDYVFGGELLFLQNGFKREITKWLVNLKTFVPKLSRFPPYYLVSSVNKSQLVGINTGIIKCPPASSLGEYCYTKAASRDPNTLKWGDTGPKLFSKAVIKLNLQEWVMPSPVFYPLNWWDWKWVIEDDKTDQIEMICQESYAIHLWNEMWRRNKIDKDATFSPNCFYERLKKRYHTKITTVSN